MATSASATLATSIFNGAILAGNVTANVSIGDSFTVIDTHGGTVTGKFGNEITQTVNGVPLQWSCSSTARSSRSIESDPSKVVLDRVKANTDRRADLVGQPVALRPGKGDVHSIRHTRAGAALPITAGSVVQFGLDNGAHTEQIVIGANGVATYNPMASYSEPLSVGNHVVTAQFLGDSDLNITNPSVTPTGGRR